MGDMGDMYRDMKAAKKEQRQRLGVNCPLCPRTRPFANPSKLMPGQRCKVDGYIDPRPVPDDML